MKTPGRILCFFLFLPFFGWSAENKTLRIACFDFPGTFNPVYATSETAQAVANKVYQSLFYFDRQGNICPELIEAFSWNEARLEIALTLRKGACFADGSAVGSQDVVATVALLKNPAFEYPYMADLDFLEKIEATGPLSLRIKVKGSFAPWRNYLTFKILKADEIKKADPRDFRRHAPLGSGPYKLASTNEPWGFELDKNPCWAQGQQFMRIRYTVLGEPRQAPLKLLSDEIDAVEIHGDDAKTYWKLKKWRERFRLLAYKKFGFTYLAFNLRNPAINPNLRRIFYNRLIGGRFLVDFLEGAGDTIYSPFLPFGSEKRPQSFPTVPLPGRRSFRILTNSESELRKQLVLFMCEEMKGCGIDLEPVFVEYQTFLKYVKQGDFDLAVSAFLLDMDWNLKDILASSGYFNYAGFSDPRMDAILEEGLREMDAGKRRKIYERAHGLWLESLPLIPLFNLNYYMGISRAIQIPQDRFRVVGSCGDFFYNLQGW
jgi:peptide/nickel transport system substrate-binding protein